MGLNRIMGNKREKIIVFCLLSIFLGQGVYSILSLSAAFDEPIHLVAGYYYWRSPEYKAYTMENYPVAELISTIPLLLLNPRLPDASTGWRGGSQYDYAFNFLFHNRLDASLMLNSGRVMVLLFGVLLGYVIFLWARELFGINGGLFSLFLYIFCPSMLANATLVTADFLLAVFFFLSIYLTVKFFKHYNQVSALLAGLFAGLAMGTKFSAIMLIPFAFIICAAEFVTRRKDFNTRRAFRGTFLYLLSICFTLLFLYRFVYIRYFFAGIKDYAGMINTASYYFFLMGKYSQTGWWYYFPINFLLKTPVPLLIFVLLSVPALSRISKNVPRNNAVEKACILVVPLAFLIIASHTKFQIGHRHIIMIYPFLLVASGSVLEYFKSRISRGILIFLCIFYMASGLKVSPFYIAYFNEFIGRPENSYKYLVDSNNDWGQGLKSLAKYLRKEKIESIYLSYFGTGDPSYYGIKYRPVGCVSSVEYLKRSENISFENDRRVLFVVSVTNLQGGYYTNHSVFNWLKNREPVKIIAASLFVYDITDDVDAHRQIGDLLLKSGDKQGYKDECVYAENLIRKEKR